MKWLYYLYAACSVIWGVGAAAALLLAFSMFAGNEEAAGLLALVVAGAGACISWAYWRHL